ncbi:MAG: hypothetical protein PHP25_04805 [Candidatus Moranbacteria bacterium]|nr:hypothetical protein [Candidatus Moranbacteria bacterium]
MATTPVAILFSQGYRFDQKKMIFVHSGAITLKSLPASVNIYLDGKPQSGKNLDIINSSMTVGGLRPGNYHIAASLDGYSNWEKNVEVHSGLSTEFWNVVLAPQNPQVSELASQNVDRFFPSPFGKKTAYLENLEKGISLWVTDFKKNETHQVFSGDDALFSKDKLDNLEWNFKEDLMLVPVVRGNQKDYLVASSDGNIESSYLSDMTKFKDIRKARWSPKDKNIIYFLAKGSDKISNLYAFNLDSKALDLVVPEISVYDISQNSIYFLQKNNILFKSDLDGSGTAQVNNRPFTDSDIGENSRMIVYDEDRQILISGIGELFVRNNGNTDLLQKMGDGILGAQFSDDGKKLLFWNSNEIKVMFLREWEVQPYRDENEIQTIIRLSTPVDNVFWFRDYEHIFFSAQNKIKLIELDSRDHRTILDIFENNLDEFPAAYDSGNGYYYFVKDSNGEKKIFYFALPEKTGFFGQ